MGWWKVQDTDDIVGDDVFSILRSATLEVAKLYEQEFQRFPSRSEWQRLMHDSLLPLIELRSPEERSLFRENATPEAVRILLDSDKEK
jgi:hypothetical protein